MTTEIDRDELIGKLRAVEPALAAASSVPQLTHFWFTGKALMAFNDEIAISTPLRTGFEGAVPGQLLLSLLSNFKPDTAVLEADGAELRARAPKGKGRSRFKLGMLPPRSFIFSMPEGGGRAADPGAIIGAISGCARSFGADASIPEQLGVTVVPNGKGATLYATNNATISASAVSETAVPRRVILSTLFCKQLVRLCGGAGETSLEIAADHALLRAGDYTLFGKLVDSPRPYDFARVVDENFPRAARKRLVPFPKGLGRALADAVIITGAQPDAQASTRLTVSGGYLALDSRSDSGGADDRLRLSEPHGDVAIDVNAKLLAAGVDDFDRMLVTDRCVVMSNGGGDLYVVAARSARA